MESQAQRQGPMQAHSAFTAGETTLEAEETGRREEGIYQRLGVRKRMGNNTANRGDHELLLGKAERVIRIGEALV